jgi:hypothetical protein
MGQPAQHDEQTNKNKKYSAAGGRKQSQEGSKRQENQHFRLE